MRRSFVGLAWVGGEQQQGLKQVESWILKI